MKIPGQSQLVIDVVRKQVKKECRILTSNKFQSVAQHSMPSHLTDFPCDRVLAEWKTVAPTFMQFLQCAIAAKDFTEQKTKGARTKKKISWSRKKPEVTMVSMILLKARSKFMVSICTEMYWC